MYIAKNKDGVVNLFYKKPKRKDGYWLSQDGKYFTIDSSSILLNWNDEPLEVVLSTNEEKQILYNEGVKKTINKACKLLTERLQFGYHSCNGINLVKEFRKAMEE